MIGGLINMWIEMVEKKDYENSSKLTGLRVSFDKRIEKERTIEIKKFADWLRQRYYFPIRCNIHICYCSYFEKCDQVDWETDGAFYYKDNCLPTISIAGYPRKKSKDKDFHIQIQARMVYYLTFYFQWFFYEFEKRTDRSLRIEAKKWQNYIMDEYLDDLE